MMIENPMVLDELWQDENLEIEEEKFHYEEDLYWEECIDE